MFMWLEALNICFCRLDALKAFGRGKRVLYYKSCLMAQNFDDTKHTEIMLYLNALLQTCLPPFPR